MRRWTPNLPRNVPCRRRRGDGHASPNALNQGVEPRRAVPPRQCEHQPGDSLRHIIFKLHGNPVDRFWQALSGRHRQEAWPGRAGLAELLAHFPRLAHGGHSSPRCSAGTLPRTFYYLSSSDTNHQHSVRADPLFTAWRATFSAESIDDRWHCDRSIPIYGWYRAPRG